MLSYAILCCCYTAYCAVGYGDLVPTSWLGRMIACMVALSGTVVLALPIGIVGGKFAEQYDSYARTKKMGQRKLNLDCMNDEAMTALFRLIDKGGTQSIDIFEVRQAFEDYGMKFDGAKLLHYFAQADRNCSGKLSLSEFIQLCQQLQVSECE